MMTNEYKNPTKTRETEEKTRTRRASNVKMEISSNQPWKNNTQRSVTGEHQRRLTIKNPSIDPGTRAKILEV